MSNWTYIVSTIDIDTNIEDINIKERVLEILKDAPKITGSERNADVFVNILSGHNVSIGCDCEHCKNKESIINYENGSFSCEREDNFICPEAEYQTRVIITIAGSLRDRVKEETKEEYKKFIKFIKSQPDFYIMNKTVSIINN
jgi:hypothetical protein